MNDEMKLIREVNIQAENAYEHAVQMGDRAAHSFQLLNTPGKKNNHRSQMTNLENIAESAFKTSDIFNYIKRQTARQDYWRQALPGYPVPGRKDNTDVGFGEGLREY